MLQGDTQATDRHNSLSTAMLPQFHGILVMDKVSGPTSAQCLNILKKLGQKKIGHAGTLDPMASGVLLVLLGQATKLSSYLLEGGKKVYSGELRLGMETDTWDREGRIVSESSYDDVSTEEVEREIALWPQMTEQEAPAFSALKHKGKPLYKLARKGEETPVKIRKISIYEAGMLQIDMPFVRFRVSCSSGTYIRSLAHSLGKRLGCGAVLTGLTREYSHPFGIEHACQLADIEAVPRMMEGCLRPLQAARPDWPCISLTPGQACDVRNGKTIAAAAHGSLDKTGQMAFLCEGSQPLAIGKLGQCGQAWGWQIVRGLFN